MTQAFHKEAIAKPIFELIGEVSDELGMESYVIGGICP